MVDIPLFSASFSYKVNASQKLMCQLIFCGTNFQLVGTFVEVHCAESRRAQAWGFCLRSSRQGANLKSWKLKNVTLLLFLGLVDFRAWGNWKGFAENCGAVWKTGRHNNRACSSYNGSGIRLHTLHKRDDSGLSTSINNRHVWNRGLIKLLCLRIITFQGQSS